MLRENKHIILLFLVIELCLYLVMHFDKQNRLEEYLRDMSRNFDAEFQIILNSYEDKAQIAFDAIMDKEEVKTLFADAIEHPSQRDAVRQALYVRLLPSYAKLKQFGFQQVHFHLPDNHSFLRMHDKEHFGDDLYGFRETVSYTNRTHEKISGFEEGVTFSGFRFVFPLFLESRYLGSVELSFSSYALTEHLKSDYFDTRFIISAKALVGKNEGHLESHYKTSDIDSDFVFDTRLDSASNSIPHMEDFGKDFFESRSHEKSFSLYGSSEKGDVIETFIPIKNKITQEVSAYFVILSDGKHPAKITKYFWMAFGALSFLIALLMIRYAKSNKIRQNLELANSKLKNIIDAQTGMIIITDGKTMIECNTKTLAFFGVDSFETLVSIHACICSFFLPYKDFFHLGLAKEGQNWIDALEALPVNKRIVTMVGVEMTAKAFEIKINQYGDNGSSIVTLNDVTALLIKQQSLEHQAQHDKLTGIYNRRKIDSVLQKLCRDHAYLGESIGVIMIDIDHFKKINDFYGHDMGDEILKSVAVLVQNHIGEEDIFGRWGGEEFLLVMRHGEAHEAYGMAEYLRNILAEHLYQGELRITASFGVTTFCKNDTPQSLLKRVDLALYEAKQTGRNRVVALRSGENRSKGLRALLTNHD